MEEGDGAAAVATQHSQSLPKAGLTPAIRKYLQLSNLQRKGFIWFRALQVQGHSTGALARAGLW